MKNKKKENACRRCNGRGSLRSTKDFSFTCFRCNGTGIEPSFKQEKNMFKFEAVQRNMFDVKEKFTIQLKIKHPKNPEHTMIFVLDTGWICENKKAAEVGAELLNKKIKIEEV